MINDDNSSQAEYDLYLRDCNTLAQYKAIIEGQRDRIDLLMAEIERLRSLLDSKE